MGKGNRNSQKRAQDRVENPEMNLTRQKTQGKKSKTDKAVAIACIIFAIVIVASLAVSVLNSQGVFIRNTNAVSGTTEEVDAAMMGFFLNDHIMNWYNQYYYYIAYGLLKVDMSQSLRTQVMTSNDASYMSAPDYVGATWYDYFLDQVLEEVEMYVTYAEAGKNVTEKDLSLTDEQVEEIDEILAGIKTSLKESNASYSDWYGKGVKEKDVRRCYELVYRASNFSEYKQEKLEEALEANDDPVSDYVENNKENFYSADCLNFSIKESRKTYSSDKAYEDAVAAAKAAAEKIAEAKSIEDFIAAIEAYEASKKNNTTTDKKENETDTDTDVETGSDAEDKAESEFESKVDKYKDTFEYSSDTDTDGLDDWLFGEEPASEGEANVFTEEGSETVKETTTAAKKEDETEKKGKSVETTESEDTDSEEAESGSEEESEGKINSSVTTNSSGTKIYPTFTATAYYVVRSSSVDKELTHDFSYLVSNDKTALETFIESFKAGEMNNEKFVEIAESMYNEVHEDENHEHSEDEMFEYNSFEKQAASAFNTTYAALNDWVEADDRKDKTLSDIIEIKVDKETTHYAVLYFEKHNQETWYVNAFAGTVSEQFEDWYEAERKAKPVKINYDALEDLPTISYYSGTTANDGHNH